MTTITIPYSDEEELTRKLTVILQRRGFRVERQGLVPITLGQCARQVGRTSRSVSRSLKRADCPPLEATRGKSGRILKLVPSEAVLDFLTT